MILTVESESLDQTAHPQSLIRTFAVRHCPEGTVLLGVDHIILYCKLFLAFGLRGPSIIAIQLCNSEIIYQIFLIYRYSFQITLESNEQLTKLTRHRRRYKSPLTWVLSVYQNEFEGNDRMPHVPLICLVVCGCKDTYAYTKYFVRCPKVLSPDHPKDAPHDI